MGRRAAALLLLLTLLSGCWSRVELNDLGIILGMAIDIGERHPIRVTVYVPRPVSGGARESGGSEVTAWVMTQEADTLADALELIQGAAPRRLRQYHLRVVLIGEEFARKIGVGDLLDSLTTSPESQLNLKLFVVRGRAQDVLETLPLLRTVQPNNIRGILQARGGPDWRLKENLVARVSETQSMWMEALEVIQLESGPPGTPRHRVQMSGGALFYGDYLVRLVSEEQVQGVYWLLGDPRKLIVTVDCPDPKKGTLSVIIEHGKLKMKPYLRGNDPYFQVEAVAHVNMIRAECGLLAIIGEERKQLEEAVAAKIRRQLEEVIAIFQETRTDPSGFGKRLQLAYPAYFRSVRDVWPEMWSRVPVEVNVRAFMSRSGLTTGPTSKTQREVDEDRY